MQRSFLRSGLARRSKSSRLVRNWTGKWDGIPIFLLGNGPSLSQDLEPLKNYATIGANRAMRPYISFDPTILMFQDISLWQTDYPALTATQSLVLARDVCNPRKTYFEFHLKAGDYQFGKQAHLLYGSGCSGCLLAQEAYALGATSLILLGFDGKYAADGKTDFWGVNQFHVPGTLGAFARCLAYLKDNCPLPVHNCSDNDLWPKKELSAVIKQVDPKGEFQFTRQELIKKLLSHDKEGV